MEQEGQESQSCEVRKSSLRPDSPSIKIYGRPNMIAGKLREQTSTDEQARVLETPSGRLPQRRPAAEDLQPLCLPLKLIDEDPCQPRTNENPGFSIESLKALATTIQHRGVKTPISVRHHTNKPGRFIINHGARRVRASKLAKKITIPAFIDNDYSEVDQVIENLQRNELTAREIADFIGRELAKGITKKDIAFSLGKSPAFISQHITLLDLPEPVAEAYAAGQIRDVTVVNELVTIHRKYPEAVVSWLEDESQEFTRGAVRLLREFLEYRDDDENEGDEHQSSFNDDTTETAAINTSNTPRKKRKTDTIKLKKIGIQVRHNGRSARLILDRRPPAEGWAWLRTEDDGQEYVANLAQVQLIALMER